MKTFTIETNNALNTQTQGFYSVDYLGWKQDGNPDYLNNLKNDFKSNSYTKLYSAQKELEKVLLKDLACIVNRVKKSALSVCVIPRSKAKTTYSSNQLLFLESVKNVVGNITSLIDATDGIVRVEDTRTTHLSKSSYGMGGSMPYVGIAKDTCHFSDSIIGKDILLIDDIYTKTIDIDEDMIQAFLDKGAKSVTFYAVAKTIHKGISL